MTKAKLGDRVRVQYLGLKKQQGRSVELARGSQLLEFTVGSKEVISGISMGVVGMCEGEQKRMTLQPKDAYGVVRRHLIKEVSRTRFPTTLNLHVGQRLNATGVRTGRRWRVRVVEVKSETVVVDANHPQAGEILEVELQLISLHATSNGNGEPEREPRGSR